MELFERFDQLTAVTEKMNAEAVARPDTPYLRLHEYVHYCDTQTFLHAYTRKLRLPPEEASALLRFVYRDTLELKQKIGALDLYAFTYHYLKRMTYRTGNLDTPDDCVEKLDMERLAPYRAAREKQWRGEALAPEEQALLDDTLRGALEALKA